MTSEPSQHCRVVSWDQTGWSLSKEELLQRLSACWRYRHTVTRDSGQHTARQRSRHPPLSELLELKAGTGNWHQMWGVLLQWQCQGYPPPGQQVGSDTVDDQTGALAEWFTPVFLNVFFSFWNLYSLWHSKAQRHRGPGMLSSFHAISQEHHLGVLPLLSGQVNDPKNSGKLFWLKEFKSKHLIS